MVCHGFNLQRRIVTVAELKEHLKGCRRTVDLIKRKGKVLERERLNNSESSPKSYLTQKEQESSSWTCWRWFQFHSKCKMIELANVMSEHCSALSAVMVAGRPAAPTRSPCGGFWFSVLYTAAVHFLPLSPRAGCEAVLYQKEAFARVWLICRPRGGLIGPGNREGRELVGFGPGGLYV